jgi:phosphoribosylformimino-5-aminoimidazole carboxamide ribotide isomerase
MLQGPSMEIYRSIRKAHGELTLIASGGISSIRDVEELDHEGINGVIVGKAIYEKRIGLDELKSFILQN